MILVLILVLSCSKDSEFDPLKAALASNDRSIQQVMDSLQNHEVQIQLTTISRTQDRILFDEFQFQVNDSVYFYPASTVKFPVSVLALEKLQNDPQLDLDTPFFVEGDSSFTTMRSDIRDIFAVSSNDTYNRLFEYLGKDAINDGLASKGLEKIRISHRLSTSDAFELTTRPLIIQTSDSSLFTSEPIINKPIDPLGLYAIKKGKGYYSDGELIMEPMDFSERNYLPVSSLHETIKRIFFPKNFPMSERFDLNDDHMNFLKESMALIPRELDYDPVEYYDSYGKFFIYGDSKSPMASHMKIFNKVGYAYGYLTDCAYIIDSNEGIEFILTATIHVNRDGIFNDDVYEYEDIGIPFLAQLGREIHQYLLLNSNH